MYNGQLGWYYSGVWWGHHLRHDTGEGKFATHFAFLHSHRTVLQRKAKVVVCTSMVMKLPDFTHIVIAFSGLKAAFCGLVCGLVAWALMWRERGREMCIYPV